MTTNNKIYVSREFNHSKTVLFKWIVEPDLISKWFGPKKLVIKKVVSDLRVSGTYNIELLKPNGTIFNIRGTYLEIKEHTKLKFSFTYSGLEFLPPESIVEITLSEISPSITKLTLIQTFETIPGDMDNRSKSWEGMFEKLFRNLII